MTDLFRCEECGAEVEQPSDKERDPSCKCQPIEVHDEGRDWHDMTYIRSW